MRRSGCVFVFVAVICCAAGCGEDSSTAIAVRPHSVSVRLDGEELCKISCGVGSKRPDIRALIGDRAPPFDSWLRIEVQGGGHRLAIEEPHKKCKGQDFVLYTSNHGVPTFATFRRPKEGMAPHVLRHIKKPITIVLDVDEIRIRTKLDPVVDKKAIPPALRVSINGAKPIVVEGVAIAALTPVRFFRSGKRGGNVPQGRSKKKGGRRFIEGYALADVLALTAAIEQLTSARAHGPNSAVIEIAKSSLAPDAERRFVLRANKRDQWVLQEIEGEPGRPLEGRMRGVLRVEITSTGK